LILRHFDQTVNPKNTIPAKECDGPRRGHHRRVVQMSGHETSRTSHALQTAEFQ
jgi:hypothetical protein